LHSTTSIEPYLLTLPDALPISRTAFGRTIAEHGVNRHWIAESRMEIDQARLLTLYAAHKMDTVGNKAARAEIAMIKVVGPNVAQDRKSTRLNSSHQIISYAVLR